MRMRWAEIASDWCMWSERIHHRFPHLDSEQMNLLYRDRKSFEAHLAATHNLSLIEAREEIDDFLYVETLARELSGISSRVQ